MKTLTPKTVKKESQKRDSKEQREQEVLFGLIELYIKTGKPVGSNSLKDERFEHLSSATIRNYFSKLEEDGYLLQQHTSGGREPTEKAFRLYALASLDCTTISKEGLTSIEKIKEEETKETYHLIEKTLTLLADLSETAVFLSLPRFDKDFVTNIKVIPVDHSRTLVVLITDFGNIQPEVIQTDKKLHAVSAKRIENYLLERLSNQDLTSSLDEEEELVARKIYNEVMVRFLVNSLNFSQEDIIQTGFSNFLKYTEFQDQTALIEGMNLLENKNGLRHLIRDAIAHVGSRVWIGKDLIPFGAKTESTAILTIPYTINNQPVGAIGIVGPLRLPYPKLFGLLKATSDALSEALTKNLYKFKITFRASEPLRTLLPEIKFQQISYNPIKMIETRKKT